MMRADQFECAVSKGHIESSTQAAAVAADSPDIICTHLTLSNNGLFSRFYVYLYYHFAALNLTFFSVVLDLDFRFLFS